MTQRVTGLGDGEQVDVFGLFNLIAAEVSRLRIEADPAS